MSGGTGNKSTSILAQSLKKIKVFANQHIEEYRFLVNSERNNLAWEHFSV